MELGRETLQALIVNFGVRFITTITAVVVKECCKIYFLNKCNIGIYTLKKNNKVLEFTLFLKDVLGVWREDISSIHKKYVRIVTMLCSKMTLKWLSISYKWFYHFMVCQSTDEKCLA